VPRLTVATFNAHYGFDVRRRRFDVVEVLRRLEADVIVVQESWRPDATLAEVDRFAQAEGYQATHEPMGPARITGGGKPRLVLDGGPAEGQLVISMLSRVPARVSVVEMLHLRYDSAPRRFAVRAEVEVGGDSFVYLGTHLDHLTHGSPIQVRRLLQELPGPDQPAALAGDMNMWGPVLVSLLPGWRRAVKGRSWPNGFPHSQIDHIVINDPVRPVAGQVVRAGRSDHLPVRAVLDF
jgi:endonuclease/exonuclease/phosphatase family metal-dependent hydrolase